MANFDFLDQYTNVELAAMIPAIQKKMKQNEKAEKEALRKKIAALVAEGGYTVEDIMSGVKVKAKRPVKPKYQNPEDGQTWSGRGRKPKWVQEIVDNGGNIEDYAI